ncbi:Fur family transcriptional regulator [Fusibacter sp. JL216-2]|uniref:Fur family transcriptional regulator n=1 Tax=Fusibacter sp. JL216-2 TaxID=3071453 RepID=UPI003D34A98B
MERKNIDIPKYLTERGIKASYQRIRILKYFQEHLTHPTVNDIYLELVPEIPTLSKTTVYNTLNLFVDKNILDVILIEENEARYDWAMQTHGHFKCVECGNVFDLNIQLNPESIPDLDGYEIKEQHVYIKGVCTKCQKSDHIN